MILSFGFCELHFHSQKEWKQQLYKKGQVI